MERQVRHQLRRLTEEAGKYTYETLLSRLVEDAKAGKGEVYVLSDEVSEYAIRGIKNTDLIVEKLEGEKYGINGTWKISW